MIYYCFFLYLSTIYFCVSNLYRYSYEFLGLLFRMFVNVIQQMRIMRLVLVSMKDSCYLFHVVKLAWSWTINSIFCLSSPVRTLASASIFEVSQFMLVSHFIECLYPLLFLRNFRYLFRELNLL